MYLKTRMHSSRMRTARSSGRRGVSTRPPRSRPPLPGSRPPPRAARHAGIPPAMHVGIPPPPPVNRMTNRCKNITLAQTSFAGDTNRLVMLTETDLSCELKFYVQWCWGWSCFQLWVHKGNYQLRLIWILPWVFAVWLHTLCEVPDYRLQFWLSSLRFTDPEILK